MHLVLKMEMGKQIKVFLISKAWCGQKNISHQDGLKLN